MLALKGVLQLRRETAANLTTLNPVLAQGEPAVETDTGYLKMGDGVHAYNLLPYVAGDGLMTSIASVAALAAFPTIGLKVNTIRFVDEAGSLRIWRLNAGTDATADGVQQPADFNAGTNAKVWKRAI